MHAHESLYLYVQIESSHVLSEASSLDPDSPLVPGIGYETSQCLSKAKQSVLHVDSVQLQCSYIQIRRAALRGVARGLMTGPGSG